MARVEAADVRAWMQDTFHDDPLVVSAGPMEAAEVARVVDAVLGGLPAPEGGPVPAEPIALEQGERTVALRAPEADMALVTLAFGAPLDAPELDAGLLALAGGYGSRLFERVREEMGASYGIGAGGLVLTPERVLVTVGGAVPPERAGEVVSLVREELARLRSEGITEAELGAAREARAADEAAMLSDPGTLTGMLAEALARGEEADPAALERADALTLEGVRAALAAIIPAEIPAVVVTPDPDAAGAGCVVDVPEDAADCGA